MSTQKYTGVHKRVHKHIHLWGACYTRLFLCYRCVTGMLLECYTCGLLLLEATVLPNSCVNAQRQIHWCTAWTSGKQLTPLVFSAHALLLSIIIVYSSTFSPSSLAFHQRITFSIRALHITSGTSFCLILPDNPKPTCIPTSVEQDLQDCQVPGTSTQLQPARTRIRLLPKSWMSWWQWMEGFMVRVNAIPF